VASSPIEEERQAGETGPYHRAQIDKVRSHLASEPEVGGFDVVVHDRRD
jgi:hypothetical protein